MRACAVLALLAMGGCATLFAGDTEKVAVATHSANVATCRVGNARDTDSISTPREVEVKRSKTDLAVACSDAMGSMHGERTVPSELDGWVFANIFNAGLGVIVDASTGAMWKYQKQILVPMEQLENQYAPLPAAIQPAAVPFGGPTPPPAK